MRSVIQITQLGFSLYQSGVGFNKSPSKEGLEEHFVTKSLLSSNHRSLSFASVLVQLRTSRNQCFTFRVVCVLIKVIDKALSQVFRFAFPL